MLPLRGADMNKQNIFLCTRSTLARILMEAGVNGVRVINPYNPQYWAWEFEITPVVISVTMDFYKSIGKPLPKSIERVAADDKQP